MTNEKLLEVIAYYEVCVPQELELRQGPGGDQTGQEAEALAHLVEMFPQMREFVATGRREKLMRWLGWVQGVLFMCGVFSLEEMKAHNMPDSPGEDS